MKKFSLVLALFAVLGLSTPAFAMSNLSLTANCTNTPSSVLNFTVGNTNGFDVPYTWDRDSGTEVGSGTVLANSTIDFTTGTTGVSSSVSLSWYDVDASTTATTTVSANYTACPVVPAPSLVTASPSAGIGGHRHSPAEMAKLFAPNLIAILQARLALAEQQLAVLEAK